ncbi:CAZyme family GT1 [Penicillium atrosanguineum]|uniref:CAZyme family GT1 n=1 Tax=Penicillium atrosanguineum TaxID=1132637 RepID=UPI0023A53761|nr:CAZyme family GT1 [Penicillium atrosanguineum]KAJ5313191.1 CAZyme family GT1 [Penicillium atrosanguineum]
MDKPDKMFLIYYVLHFLASFSNSINNFISWFAMALTDILCIHDLEKAAQGMLSQPILDYFNDGSGDGVALMENISAFEKYKIRPRILRNVSNIETKKRALGSTMSFPLAIAPTAMQCMAHEEGEKATARAAARANVFMGVSTFATTTLEDIKQSGDCLCDNVYMLQLYIFKDRHTTEILVKRAESAGYKAILLTCDTPRLGNRHSMIRNNFRLPSHLQLPNFDQYIGKEKLGDVKYPNTTDDNITWDETLLWLRSLTKMEIWLKGISTAEDVELAVQSSANITGVIVSNHGGRQLDSALSTLDSLSECVKAAKSKDKSFQVWFDGGIRKGCDIFKALALGADGVMIGRAVLWGLTVGGEEGVFKALSILRAEFELTMALSGCRTLSDIKSSNLARKAEGGFFTRL